MSEPPCNNAGKKERSMSYECHDICSNRKAAFEQDLAWKNKELAEEDRYK